MALSFNPPEDLIRDYLRRPSPGQIASEGIGQALQLYLQQKNIEDQMALKRKQMGLLENADSRQQGEFARNYNPAELPGAGGAYNQYSPQDFGTASPQAPTLTGDAQMRATLTQSGAPATLGPSAAAPSMIDRWNSRSSSSGIGMGQNPALAPAPTNPQEQSNLDFASKYPQGLKGAIADRPVGRPLDDKRTFQEKQEVSVNGQPVGYMAFDTRSGGKSFYSYNPEVYPNGEAPAGSVFIPKVKPEIPSAAVEKGAGQAGFLDLIKDVRDNYNKKFVGPIDSRVRDVKQVVDMPSIGMGASKEAADFTRPLADLRSAIVNERTGAAVGERKEWDRLMQLMPDDQKSDPDFLAKLDSIEKRYNQIIANRSSAFGQSGYRDPGVKNPGSSGGGNDPQATGPYTDSQKEARYQAWKAKQVKR